MTDPTAHHQVLPFEQLQPLLEELGYVKDGKITGHHLTGREGFTREQVLVKDLPDLVDDRNGTRDDPFGIGFHSSLKPSVSKYGGEVVTFDLPVDALKGTQVQFSNSSRGKRLADPRADIVFVLRDDKKWGRVRYSQHWMVFPSNAPNAARMERLIRGKGAQPGSADDFVPRERY